MLYIPPFAEDPAPPTSSTPTQEASGRGRRPSSANSGLSTPTHTNIQFENYTVSSYVSLELQQVQDKDPDICIINLILELNQRLANDGETPTKPPAGPRRSMDMLTPVLGGEGVARRQAVESQRMEWSILGPQLHVRGQRSGVMNSMNTSNSTFSTPSAQCLTPQTHFPVPTAPTLMLQQPQRPRSGQTQRHGSLASLPLSSVMLQLTGNKILGPTAPTHIIAMHGGIEEETFVEDGTMEEVFACHRVPTDPDDDPFAVVSQVCYDHRRVHPSRVHNDAERNKRREELGFPSVSPNSCLRETLACDVFYAMFDVVSRSADMSGSEVEDRNLKGARKKNKVKRKKKKAERLDEYLSEQQERYSTSALNHASGGGTHTATTANANVPSSHHNNAVNTSITGNVGSPALPPIGSNYSSSVSASDNNSIPTINSAPNLGANTTNSLMGSNTTTRGVHQSSNSSAIPNTPPTTTNGPLGPTAASQLMNNSQPSLPTLDSGILNNTGTSASSSNGQGGRTFINRAQTAMPSTQLSRRRQVVALGNFIH